MPLKVPDQGLLRFHEFINLQISAGVTLHLYVNNYTPVSGSLLADFTEATFPGYAAAAAVNWGGPTIVGGRSTALCDLCTFTLSATGGPYPIYGYFIKFGIEVLAAERDPNGPISLANVGESYNVLPKLTLRSEF